MWQCGGKKKLSCEAFAKTGGFDSNGIVCVCGVFLLTDFCHIVTPCDISHHDL